MLSRCALALLAVATARLPGTPVLWAAPDLQVGADTTDQPGHWRDTGKPPARPGETPPRHIGLIRITVPAARRLFALLTPPANQVSEIFRDAWSSWRRRHQARAQWHHYQGTTPGRILTGKIIRTERLTAGNGNPDCSTGPCLHC